MSLFALSEFLVGKWENVEENMSSDSESSFVGLVYQQRNTALAASFLSCPPYCIARTIVAPKVRQKVISRGILAVQFKYHS